MLLPESAFSKVNLSSPEVKSWCTLETEVKWSILRACIFHRKFLRIFSVSNNNVFAVHNWKGPTAHSSFKLKSKLNVIIHPEFVRPIKDVRGWNKWPWHLINKIRGKDILSDYGSSCVSSRYLCHKNKYHLTRAEPISIVPVSVCYVGRLWQSTFRIALRFVFNFKVNRQFLISLWCVAICFWNVWSARL